MDRKAGTRTGVQGDGKTLERLWSENNQYDGESIGKRNSDAAAIVERRTSVEEDGGEIHATTKGNDSTAARFTSKSCIKQKRKRLCTLETVEREASMQIHAQCQDRGELVDAIVECYHELLEKKDQDLDEAILENRRLQAMSDFMSK